MARSKAKRGGRRSGRFNQKFGKNWRTDGFTPPKSTFVGRDPKGIPIMVDSDRGEKRRRLRLAASIRAAMEQAELLRVHGRRPVRLESDDMEAALQGIRAFTPTLIAKAIENNGLATLLTGFEGVLRSFSNSGDLAEAA